MLRKIILIIIVFSCALSSASAQNLKAIDHIPIVVKNLDSIKKIFKKTIQ
jgi:hypothetical protein